MTPTAYRATICADLAQAKRALLQPEPDRATLSWACTTILRHSRDAWLRDAAATILPEART